MPDQNILMRVSADDRNVLRTFRKLTKGVKDSAKATKQVVVGMKKIEVATKGVDSESKKLEKQAARMWRKAMTPLQRYKAGMKETTQLLIKQKLTVEQVRQVRKNLQRTLQRELGLTAAAARGDAKRAARLREVAAASRQAAAASQRALGGMLITARSLLSSLGLVGGVAGAVQLVRMEYDRLIESQQRARDVSLPLADAERAALGNLGARSAEEQQAILDQVNAASNRLGVPRQAILEGASTALSARGSLPASLAIEATARAIESAPHDPGTSTALAGAALDITKLGGGITPKEAIGFLKEGLIRSRVTDAEKFARAAPQAINTAVQRGATPREGMALFDALTQGMVEAMGRRAGTATASLAEQIAKPRIPEGDTPEAIQARTELAKLEAAGGLRPRLKLLQADENLRKAFLENTSFEIKARASIEQLLAGGNVLRDFDTFVKELPKATEAGPAFERQVRIESATELQRTAAFDRAVRQTAESIAISDPTRARLGIIQEQFRPILEDTGSTRLASGLAKLSATVEGMSSFVRILEQQSARLEQPTEARVMGDAVGMAIVRVAREPTEAEGRQLEAINRLIAILRETIDRDRQSQKPLGLLPRPRERAGLQIESPLRTNPAIQEQRARLGEFFVPLTEPTIPDPAIDRSPSPTRRAAPSGSATLLTDRPSSEAAVQTTPAGTATSTQPDSWAVVGAVERMVQTISQGSDRVVDAIQQQTADSTPALPSGPNQFDQSTLGSPGTMDVNNPADPEDR